MKSKLSSFWQRCSGALMVGVAIAINTLPASSSNTNLSKPTSNTANASLSDKIAYKILSLQESNQRWIQIDLPSQRLIAWEGTKPAYSVVISSGKRSTPTRSGIFAVQSKYLSTRMKGPGYDVPNVPNTMYYSGGYAIHGAYWHNRFGTPVSHGCINLPLKQSKWLFNWASVGTPVIVHR